MRKCSISRVHWRQKRPILYVYVRTRITKAPFERTRAALIHQTGKQYTYVRYASWLSRQVKKRTRCIDCARSYELEEKTNEPTGKLLALRSPFHLPHLFYSRSAREN